MNITLLFVPVLPIGMLVKIQTDSPADRVCIMITFISRYCRLIILTQEWINLGGKSSLQLSAFIIANFRPEKLTNNQSGNHCILIMWNSHTNYESTI